ncbi:hypothetical protein L596_009144 [Steinernema carpocapsae]|uniref:Uncharacterized protein n=1 Tax=Steinernema carpocapsae TaxID=34508 RepID=A0A4U5PF16_STECR|nr:hypothetical protein L596_009144 [Steinernema carpocapsae]
MATSDFAPFSDPTFYSSIPLALRRTRRLLPLFGRSNQADPRRRRRNHQIRAPLHRDAEEANSDDEQRSESL